MKMHRLFLRLALLLALVPGWAAADRTMVAAAANVQAPLERIAQLFEQETGHRLVLSFGATGKHYAQIKHRAPFDLFLAADAERPRMLEQEGGGVAGTRFTYAIGRLALWSPRAGLVDAAGAVLAGGEFRYLAIANPRLAPYGAAAREVLQAQGLWDAVRPKLVLGESIGQAYQFVGSGNADLGFVALSQIKHPGEAIKGSVWIVPQEFHQPIDQQAILVRDTPVARAFWEFLQSAAAREIFRNHGYDLPTGAP